MSIPTTTDIEGVIVGAYTRDKVAPEGERSRAFFAWLDAEKAKWQAKALREAGELWQNMSATDFDRVAASQHQNRANVALWLHERADHIEKGGQG